MTPTRVLASLLLLATAGTAGASRYTLRPGDTLGVVAKRFGVSVQALATANAISDPDRVVAGRTLVVPSSAEVRPIAAVTATHRVQPGETLGRIAQRVGTTTAELQRLNGIPDPRRLRAGTILRLPRSRPGGVCPVRGASDADFADGFGSPRHGGRTHQGNDIFARRGTAVVAPSPGVLSAVRGTRTGIGFYLRADDGTTYYGAHLDRLDATAGRVTTGQTLGVVGTTGNAAGLPPHLHFELKPGGGEPVDPYPTLRAWC